MCIRDRLIELAKLANIEGDGEEVIAAEWGGSLMKAALEKFRSEEWRSKQQEANKKVKAEAASRDGGLSLVPKVIPYNDKNEPQADVETYVYTPERPRTETIPWGPWLESVVAGAAGDEALGRHVFQHTCMWSHFHLATCVAKSMEFPYPITLQKLKGNITALATEDISPGCLVIPVFCMRDSSYFTPASKACRDSEEVSGRVKWKQPVDESDVREVEVKIDCQPERRQPGDPSFRGDNWTDCHPFWHIRRSNCVGEFNSAVVEVAIKVITSSPLKELKTDLYHSSPGLLEFEVTVPCIVNTAKIAGGAEIVLRWENKPAYKTLWQKRKRDRRTACGSPMHKKRKKR